MLKYKAGGNQELFSYFLHLGGLLITVLDRVIIQCLLLDSN